LWQRLRGDLQLPNDKAADDALTAYFEEVGSKIPRYYQTIAINRAVEAVLRGQPRILITMATGTGKTFVAFQIVWRLWKSKRKKRILYLADQHLDRSGEGSHVQSTGRSAAQDQKPGH
jgi:type I restriction enzyme R subunit